MAQGQPRPAPEPQATEPDPANQTAASVGTVAPAPPPVLDRSVRPPPPPVDVSWGELSQVALLGTSRRAVPAGVRSGRVGLPDGPDELLVLGAAAAAGAWRAAGPTLAGWPNLDVTPAGVDPRPAAPADASQLLRMVLDGGTHVGDGDALALRWLERAAAAGYRVGHGELVAVLDWASAAKARRPAARAVIGVRGAWLASGSPAWSWALGADEEVATDDLPAMAARFRTARRDERADLLRQVRATDPDLGRHLLDEARATDPAPARLALVQAMAPHLSMADEPLLEVMLDDRARTVRTGVADLLSRLPDSRYASRMAQRLAPLVQQGRRSIRVELPTTYDDQAARDAIDTDDAPGHRAEARRRIVAGTPLAFWSQLGDDRSKLVGRMDDELCADLVGAACRQADATWAAVLVGRQPDHDLELMALWADADPGGAAVRCTELLRGAASMPARHNAMTLASQVPGPWPPALSRELVAAGRTQDAVWLQPFLVLGSRLDPAVLPALDAWLDELQQAEHPPALKFVRSLRHSIDLRNAIDASLPTLTTVPSSARGPR